MRTITFGRSTNTTTLPSTLLLSFPVSHRPRSIALLERHTNLELSLNSSRGRQTRTPRNLPHSFLHLTRHSHVVHRALLDYVLHYRKPPYLPSRFVSIAVCSETVADFRLFDSSQYVEMTGHSGIRSSMGNPVLTPVLKPLNMDLIIEDHDLHHRFVSFFLPDITYRSLTNSHTCM